jgi:predicted hotdog family 3-hydroxylacyl-ACP dehydratase
MHRGQMLLIDRLIEVDEDHALGEVVISRQSAFFRSGRGVPAYVGIEYMAQTVAAFDGARRMVAQAPPAVGFLLGTRRYRSNVPFFSDGARLQIEVTMVFNENGMASFECAIRSDGGVDASASLNVYRPENGQFALPGDVT